MTRRTWMAVVLAVIASCSDENSVSTPDAPATTDAGSGLRSFTPPTEPGPRGVLLSVSGEGFANAGYAFPPTADQEVYFVDGWELHYDRILVTFDHVTLADNPDKSPTDESQTGAVVAEVDGPWAVDLHKGGTLDGKGGGPGEAAPFAAFTGTSGGGAFDPTVRYAFSFDTVAASSTAINVNLDDADQTEYADMVSKGYTAVLVGTASWKGGSSCVTTGSYDFTQLPATVKFHLGFTAPTSYINAQNPDNTGAAFDGEESQRGIQVSASASIVSQVTFHLDHAFWDSFVHDSPAHFDPFAAQHAGESGTPTAQMEDYVGKPFTPVTDKNGVTVPWRFCPPATKGSQTGGMTFDTLSIQVNPAGDPSQVIRDFYDYTLYNHSTWGHLNADGLSFVERHYPSPP